MTMLEITKPKSLTLVELDRLLYLLMRLSTEPWLDGEERDMITSLRTAIFDQQEEMEAKQVTRW